MQLDQVLVQGHILSDKSYHYSVIQFRVDDRQFTAIQVCREWGPGILVQGTSTNNRFLLNICKEGAVKMFVRIADTRHI
jgi:hypothetical protein